MNLDSMSAMTGIPVGPRKKTHRGKRSRGHGPKPAVATHDAKCDSAHATLTEAMECGDHATAKSAALSLAKALHKKMQKDDGPIPVPSI